MLSCRYGYLTNTKVKFILVTTDLDVRDADVRNVSMTTMLGDVSIITFKRVQCLK